MEFWSPSSSSSSSGSSSFTSSCSSPAAEQEDARWYRGMQESEPAGCSGVQRERSQEGSCREQQRQMGKPPPLCEMSCPFLCPSSTYTSSPSSPSGSSIFSKINSSSSMRGAAAGGIGRGGLYTPGLLILACLQAAGAGENMAAMGWAGSFLSSAGSVERVFHSLWMQLDMAVFQFLSSSNSAIQLGRYLTMLGPPLLAICCLGVLLLAVGSLFRSRSRRSVQSLPEEQIPVVFNDIFYV